MGGARGAPRYDAAMSMNRTALSALFSLASLIGTADAQGDPMKPVTTPQVKPAEGVVKSVEAAEAAIKSLRMTMTTKGKLPGGLTVTTRGEIRVLRKTQVEAVADPQPTAWLFSQLEYAFGDGLKGRMETARTADGILLFEEDPAFGAVFLQIAPDIVADLEWASAILKKSDLPGMADGRAQTPLGSGVIRDLMRTFDLAIADDESHDGNKGIWLRGTRRAGLDAQDPDLPLADRVEAFVRDRDHALLLARFYVGTDVIQELAVEKLELGAKLQDSDFTVDGHGERIRQVQVYAPMWEQIQEALTGAEAKAKPGEVRPSKVTAKPAAGGK